MSANKQMIGHRFGALVVLREHPERNKQRVMWVCRCDCGNEHIALGTSIRYGSTRSCGCKQVKSGTDANNFKHGMCETQTYHAWKRARHRCSIPTDQNFHRYGGRGIKVCERWQVFQNFLEDMGECPKGMSLDRIDNDGDYEPGNCRWATSQQQMNNTRRSIKIEWEGKEYTARDLAEIAGISYEQALYRLKAGWEVPAIINTPVTKRNKKHVNSRQTKKG